MLLHCQHWEVKTKIQNPGKLNYSNTMYSKSQCRKLSKLLQIKLIMEKNFEIKGGKKKKNQGSV